MRKTFQLEGLDCAGCAAELEEEIQQIEGVRSASVVFVTQKLTVEYEDESVLEKVKDAANHFEEVKVVEEKKSEGIFLHLSGLHCAACAMELEEELQKLKGVEEVKVDFVSQTIALKATEEGVQRVVKAAGHFEKVKVLDKDKVAPKKESHTKEIILIAVSALFFLAGILVGQFLGGYTAGKIAAYVFYAVAYFSVGYPVLISTGKNIVKGKIFDENFLMTVASIGAVCLGELTEGVAVMLLYQIGELLQGIAVGSSRQSITRLMELKSESATKRENGEWKSVPPEELAIGDVVLVKAGEKIPADGVLLSENAVLDTKSLTGESEPSKKAAGEELLSGCINAGGVFEMRITRAFEDSAAKKILDLVENSAAKKAAPEKFITKFAKYYTPIVCALAAVAAVFVPVILGLVHGGGYAGYFREYINTALKFLVISCPCALIISVPLTYFGGIGSAARSGILVKGATYLDAAAKAKTVAFDKTGTLTEGNFTVVGAYPEEGVSKEELLGLAAAAEAGSSHPIAKAFSGIETAYKADSILEIAGHGVEADIGGKPVSVGNDKLLAERGVALKEAKSEDTVVYVAAGGKYLGYIEIGDRIRGEAKDAIAELKELGVQETVMLTGDRRERAEKVAKELGVSKVFAELLPNDKLTKAEECKQSGGLIYVGDGINDAPVMAAADCSVSMGKLGSAAAVEASDLVLISDNLGALPKCVKIARKTRRIVKQNIGFSIAMKIAFMVLSAVGWIPLWLAVFADVGVMLLAVLNSMRMRRRVK